MKYRNLEIYNICYIYKMNTLNYLFYFSASKSWSL